MGGQKTLIGLTRWKFRLRDFKIPLSNMMRNIGRSVENLETKQIHRQEQESLVSYHLTLLIYHLPQRALESELGARLHRKMTNDQCQMITDQ